MKECIAIINQKGGVGKSTTANALGAGIFLKGFRVLYIDLDAQGNLSYSMDATGKAITAMEVLTGTATAREAILKTPQGDLIPASPALASADAILTDTGKEYRLKEAIEPVRKGYDYIILDTPPALGVLTVNALTACDSVIIPAQADAYSLQGIGHLSLTIQTVMRYCNPALFIKGILATRYNSRVVLTRDITELLEDTARELNTVLYRTRIRECVALRESQASKENIYRYSPRSNATVDYTAFVEEVLAQTQNRKRG